MTASPHIALYDLLRAPRTRREIALLLEDLLSPAEIENIAERWHIMRQVAAGTSHRAIATSAHTSIAKVSRCARVVYHGNGSIRALLRPASTTSTTRRSSSPYSRS